ncbi:hypothetical protein K7432_016888 [Basidiobolus ranarum]|uniref:Uncharacterized protein n=1 Tax=Basidiobolus ranarum TaxID=34480 RepID=A0ABR2WE60_9FUNG
MYLAPSADAYYCNDQKNCGIHGFTCKNNKYCVSEVEASATCASPFVARISNVYTQFCSVPNNLDVQVADASDCVSYSILA